MEQASPLKPAWAASGATTGRRPGRPKTLDSAAIAAQLAKLGTSARGPTMDQARQRLAKDGPNAINATEKPLWHKAINYFWGPIPAFAPADAGVFRSIGGLGESVDKVPFVPAISDFYFTNPIVRASRVMAECSALARGAPREAAE